MVVRVYDLMRGFASWVWLVGEHSTSRGGWYLSIGSHFRGWLIGGGIRHSFVGDRLWLLVTGRFKSGGGPCLRSHARVCALSLVGW